ncbi:MAG TPA: BMP family protein [Tepidisphaeraceae bacterium]|jgi:basic membrane lipoprotein Med (substrate-binding protein (PBP1-ABC) superfamily)
MKPLLLLALSLLTFSATAELRVALILPGSDTDKGWNQMAREGLDRIGKDLKAQTKAVTNVKSSDFYNQIANFAEDGYDVIICHGGEFERAAAQAARTYPKTKIVVGGCPTDIKGVITVEFMTRDASELVGYVAGKISKSRKAAFVGAMKVGPLEACYDGLVTGAKQSGTGVEVLPALWTNSWDSPILARESAENAMNAGADVIYQNVDAAAIGVFQAVQAANKAGKTVYAFGCNSNQNDLAPDVILGSVVMDIPRAYLDITKEIAGGKPATGPRKLGLKGGYVDLVLNDKHPALTDDIKKSVNDLREKLTNQK